MKKLSFILFSVILLSTGCRKDKVVITNETIIGGDPAVYINTSISGVVMDEEGDPIEDAQISLGQYTSQTDDNGFFYLKDIKADENGANVKAEKSGFHTTSQLVFPKLNSVEFVQFTLIKSDESGRLRAEDGGIIPITGGASVEFPPNGFELSGTPFTGEVVVHATFIDPLADDLFQRMPGSLLGIAADGQVLGMTTFGMIGVELFSTSGQKLELADDAKAKLTFPLPAEIIGEAPSEIHLWHYDEDQGYWIEEGRATLDGDNYIAEVSHFSFWNCDDPFPTIELDGRIVNTSGTGVAGTQVKLTRQAPTNNTGFAYTDGAGNYKGKVPKDEILDLEIYDPCGELVHSKTIGPFSTNHTLADEVVDLPVEIEFTGNLVDCMNEAVENGYIKVFDDEHIYGYLIPENDGSISSSISLCEEVDFKVVGVDLENSLASDDIPITFNTDVDLGTIEACDNIVPTITVIINGETYSMGNAYGNIYVDTSSGQSVEYTQLTAEDVVGYITMGVKGSDLGTYDVDWLSARLNSSNAQYVEPDIAVTFTRFDPKGTDAYISGTLSGSIYDTALQMRVDINGSFHVIRE